MNVPVVRAETKRIDAAARCYRETVLLSGDRLHDLDPTRALTHATPTANTACGGEAYGFAGDGDGRRQVRQGVGHAQAQLAIHIRTKPEQHSRVGHHQAVCLTCTRVINSSY
jgi:hypothetical protein